MKINCVVLNDILFDNRVKKTAKKLVDLGHEVKLICLDSNRVLDYENNDGYKIHRISLKSKKLGKLFILIWYLEFIIQLARSSKNIDILYLNDLDALVAGIFHKIFCQQCVKIIYDSHEYQCETHGITKFKRVLVFVLEYIALKFVDSVIAVSPKIALEYERIYGLKGVNVMLNVPYKYNNTNKMDLFRSEFSISAKSKIFLYQGIIDKGRGIEFLLSYFSSSYNKDDVLVLMGYGAMVEEVIEATKKSKFIFYKTAVQIEIMPKYTSSADFGFVLIEDTCLSHRYCLPNKFFEYIQYNVPVLVSDLYELRRIVDKYSIGHVINTESIEDLKSNLEIVKSHDYKKLLEKLQLIKEKYNWETESLVLNKILSELK